jgi:hypothetical protein
MDGAALLFISRFTQRPNNFLQTPKAAAAANKRGSNRKLSSKTPLHNILPTALSTSIKKRRSLPVESQASINKEKLWWKRELKLFNLLGKSSRYFLS